MLKWLGEQVAQLWAAIRDLYNRIPGDIGATVHKIVNGIVAGFNDAINWLRGQVSQLAAGIVEAIATARAIASKLVESALGSIQAWVEARLAQLQKIVYALDATLRPWVERLIAELWTALPPAIRQVLLAIFGDRLAALLDLGDKASEINQLLLRQKGRSGKDESLLDFLLSLLTPDGRQRLVDLLGRLYALILRFFQDPWKFLLNLLHQRLLPFILWKIAEGMGTVKYKLPPPPPWLEGGGAGGDLYSPGPDAPHGELTAPLASLYRSGYSFGVAHPGLDLGVRFGEPVYAMHDGVARIPAFDGLGYGEWIVVDNGRWTTTYAHLLRPVIEDGQRVEQRQVIGLANSTGNSSGDHLHLEIRFQGGYVDPAVLLGIP